MQPEQNMAVATDPKKVGETPEKNIADGVVIIPTYNEKENVAAIIEAVFGLPRKFDVLIIDDNSPDGTAAIVKRLQQKSEGKRS